ncbi:MAG: hypothetical protein ABH811_01010 [archaeon]
MREGLMSLDINIKNDEMNDAGLVEQVDEFLEILKNSKKKALEYYQDLSLDAQEYIKKNPPYNWRLRSAQFLGF